MVKRLHSLLSGLLKPLDKRRAKIQVLAVFAGLVLVGTALGIYVWQQPVVADVNYEPCDISYGEVVADWNGGGETEWNQEGYHYQVRSFRLSAQSLGALRPQIIEAEPKRISTGGEFICQEDFNEEINPAAEEYRWQGAVPDSVRIGYPEVSGARASFAYNMAQASSEGLSMSVNTDSLNNAAAWVDDGAKGEVYSGEDQPQEIYCVNYGDCDDIVRQGGEAAMRGEGFVFTADNCPEGTDCGEYWYEQSDFTDFVNTNEIGLEPFSLRLSAVSTYAPVVGTEVLLAFAYKRNPEPKLVISSREGDYTQNQRVTVSGNIIKPGTSAESARIEFALNGQPLNGENIKRLNDEQLASLNEDGVVSFKHDQLRTNAVTEHSCHELPVKVILGYDGEEFEAEASYGYCISPPRQRYTYSVASRGNIQTDMDNFRNLAAETLRHERGWGRADVVFSYVESGGDFTLWLAAPNQMTSFSSYCSPDYSCRVGRDVIINDSRWQNATPSWNEASGGLRDYRHMVINHEVGHFLGLGHYDCPSPGALAPVMQQQSIDLQGCRFNPWPTPMEISLVKDR